MTLDIYIYMCMYMYAYIYIHDILLFGFAWKSWQNHPKPNCLWPYLPNITKASCSIKIRGPTEAVGAPVGTHRMIAVHLWMENLDESRTFFQKLVVGSSSSQFLLGFDLRSAFGTLIWNILPTKSCWNRVEFGMSWTWEASKPATPIMCLLSGLSH
jgi:hypothetical protein